MPPSTVRFSLPSKLDLSDTCDCLVVGVWLQANKLRCSIVLPAPLRAYLNQLLDCGEIPDQIGGRLMIHRPPAIGAQRLLLISLGSNGKPPFKERNWYTVCQALANELSDIAVKKVNCSLHLIQVVQPVEWRVHHLARQLLSARYRFTAFRSKKEKKPTALAVSFPAADGGWSSTDKKAVRRALSQAEAIGAGETACRDLANTPPNVCTPEYMADKARAMARRHKSLKVEVYDEKKMAQEGMNALLAVARGSRNKPRLVFIHHRPERAKGKPIVLVGKGISFDTGGISLKPALAMDEMKFDMCGAASVLGVMHAIAELGLKRPVIGVMVCAENMPGGNATRPGDVITTHSGQTVEILNTDAEGRLVLCDALSYIKRFQPTTVIDIATLTGACVVALGKVVSGVMANDQSLVDELTTAGQSAMDPVWQLPLSEEYSGQLNSPVADMANIGGRDAGTITAACFLWKFCRDYRWAHLDIAGTAWLSPPQRCATGRPVPLLCRYLIDAK